MKKIIRESDMIPKGYGLAYFDVDLRDCICYPWPLNHLIAFWRLFWGRFRNALMGDMVAYYKGYHDGHIDAEESWKNRWNKTFQLYEKDREARHKDEQ